MSFLNVWLNINYSDLLLMDAFRGQMTDLVLLKLRENSIFLVRVSPNMTNFFQPLDLTFLKRKYTEEYSRKISKVLAGDIELDDTEIKLTFSVLKPLQVKSFGELYNYLTFEKRHKAIRKDW